MEKKKWSKPRRLVSRRRGDDRFDRPMTSRLVLVAPPAARPEVRRRGRREVRLPDRLGRALQEEPHGGDPGDGSPAQTGTSAHVLPVKNLQLQARNALEMTALLCFLQPAAEHDAHQRRRNRESSAGAEQTGRGHRQSQARLLGGV